MSAASDKWFHKRVYVLAVREKGDDPAEAVRKILREAGLFPLVPPSAAATLSLQQAVSALIISQGVVPVGSWQSSPQCLRIRQMADWLGLPSIYVLANASLNGRAQHERLVAVTGTAASGKSSIAQYLARSHGYVVQAIGDQIRSVIEAVDPQITGVRISSLVEKTGWEAAKRNNPRVRELQQKMATEGVRHHLGDDAWINALLARRNHPRVVVPDCRMRVEADAVRHLGGMVIRVERTGVQPANTHISEMDLTADNYDYDAILYNDSTITALELSVKIELEHFWHQ